MYNTLGYDRLRKIRILAISNWGTKVFFIYFDMINDRIGIVELNVVGIAARFDDLSSF